MKEVLTIVRKLGYKTIKNNGTWYISKPYTYANYLTKINNKIVVALDNNGITSYIDIKQLEQLENIA